MTTNTEWTPLTLRILCLHDNNSNAFHLKNQFDLLGKKLYENHSIDLVYVNGPLIIPTPDSTIDDKQKYVWWEERNKKSNIDSSSMIDAVARLVAHEPCSISDENESSNNNADENFSSSGDTVRQQVVQSKQPDCEISSGVPTHYDGLDASLMLLRQIWTSCPFWGILGVGKGAAVAALFTTILESEMLIYHVTATKSNTSLAFPHSPIPPMLPQLMIFISGESLISVDEPLLVSKHFNNSTSPFILHLVDNDKTTEQELLIRQFPQGSQVAERRGKFPSSRNAFSLHDLNVIGRFICQRKKDLYSGSYGDDRKSSVCDNNHQNEILALQTALYNAEQDAANCIAETIVLNPPAALMAVIRPQMVAGWKGNRRPQPEGGGAPCPEEFLHRKANNALHSQSKSQS
jgi:hypothetical protein